MACEIRKIVPAEEFEFQAKNNFFPLKITSIRSAILLNYLISIKLDSCPIKARYFNNGNDPDSKIGGGLLVKAYPRITINDLNEIGIWFKNEWKLWSLIRAAKSKSEITHSVFDKVSNELKKMWQANFSYMKRHQKINDEKDAIIRIPIKDYTKTNESTYMKDDYITLGPEENDEMNKNGDAYMIITYNEYRVLYEYLKGRDKDKTIKKYGKAAYSAMIGKKIEDQFLISAIEVIHSEIKQAINECEATKKSLSEQEQVAINEIRKKYQDLREAANAQKEAKLTELQSNMKQMTAMANI